MLEESINEQQFSVIKRIRSFTHASRGIWIFLKTTHNAWVHLTILTAAVALGFYFQISHTDWSLLVLAAGLVLMAEAFNTAIEIDMDLTSPQYHPYAKDTKDVAAGAVLIASITAAIIGVMIFGHHIVQYLHL